MDSISIFPSNSNNNDITRSRYPALRMWNTNPASDKKRRIVGIGEEVPEEEGLDLVQKYQRLCTKLGSYTRRTTRTPNRNRRRKSRVASPECWVLVSLLETRVQCRIGTTRVLYKFYFVVHWCCVVMVGHILSSLPTAYIGDGGSCTQSCWPVRAVGDDRGVLLPVLEDDGANICHSHVTFGLVTRCEINNNIPSYRKTMIYDRSWEAVLL